MSTRLKSPSCPGPLSAASHLAWRLLDGPLMEISSAPLPTNYRANNTGHNQPASASGRRASKDRTTLPSRSFRFPSLDICVNQLRLTSLGDYPSEGYWMHARQNKRRCSFWLFNSLLVLCSFLYFLLSSSLSVFPLCVSNANWTGRHTSKNLVRPIPCLVSCRRVCMLK